MVRRRAALAYEPRAAVKIPSNNKNARPCLDQGFAQRAEITRCIDQYRRSLSALQAPDVAIGGENHVRLINICPARSCELTREAPIGPREGFALSRRPCKVRGPFAGMPNGS